MGIRRMCIEFYYSRSRRIVVLLTLLAIAGIVFVPHFMNTHNNKALFATNEGSDHEKSHKRHKLKAAGAQHLPDTSLKFSGGQFVLGGNPFTILSGSIHYFRVIPQYWDDRLAKLKAMGLNTVTTCIPWNIHEEVKEFITFDEPEYDIVSFIEKAHKLGLYVILRPGPYIGAQLDLGGLPSWLIEESGQNVRSSNPHFLSLVERYFKKLFGTLSQHQYSNGGPIIAWQIENEYLAFGHDINYLKSLQKIMLQNGVKELMFTSDSRTSLSDNKINIPGVLKGMSMQYILEEKEALEELQKLQPDKPLFVTDLWTGHHDSWGDEHHTEKVDDLAASVAKILAMGASVNFYMFHGGTNFGFISGAKNGEKSEFIPAVTSFDFDAPLNEAGDVTRKYKDLRKVLRAHAPEHSFPKKLPDIPPNVSRKVYEPIKMDRHMPLTKMYKNNQAIIIKEVVPMEKLRINNNGGQSYGYVVYRTWLPHGAKELHIEKFRDWAQIMVGSKLLATLDSTDFDYGNMDVSKMLNTYIELKYEHENKDEQLYLDILVENLGRGYENVINHTHKGIIGEVNIDGQSPASWTVYPFSFHKNFISSMFNQEAWDSASDEKHTSVFPGFFKGTLTITSKPHDTFLDMTGWGKGVVFVNDHVLGRYWKIGPQQTLYIPSVWLQRDENTVVIFEFEKRSPDGLVKFSQNPVLDKLMKSF
ncbi:beta-galactosidase-1-like protein 3 isoform X2 [Exaiptasia diaphana]|uniref:Beta-galactosidase n=1 Tax=Exaiptasia diaphana TaxID=2652724 RepID=A0A913XGG8_EXADI|nr:beta-galactosidase-1-like protein 3 isoform X2 [Exaiptasia diaphana]